MKLKSLEEEGVLFNENQFILSTTPKEKNDWWKQFIINLTYLPIIKAYGYSRYMAVVCNNFYYTIDLESKEILLIPRIDDKFKNKMSLFYNEITDITHIKTTLINIIQ